MTGKTTTAQVVETPITVNISPIQDYDNTQPSYEMAPGFKPFTTSDRVVSIVQVLNVTFDIALHVMGVRTDGRAYVTS